MAPPGLSCSMWDLVLWSGIEPGSPSWEHVALTIGPLGKSSKAPSLVVFFLLNLSSAFKNDCLLTCSSCHGKALQCCRKELRSRKGPATLSSCVLGRLLKSLSQRGLIYKSGKRCSCIYCLGGWEECAGSRALGTGPPKLGTRQHSCGPPASPGQWASLEQPRLPLLNATAVLLGLEPDIRFVWNICWEKISNRLWWGPTRLLQGQSSIFQLFSAVTCQSHSHEPNQSYM